MQVLRFRCSNEDQCEGLGDRFVGLNVAFWLVMLSEAAFQLVFCVPLQIHAALVRQRWASKPQLSAESRRAKAALHVDSQSRHCSME